VRKIAIAFIAALLSVAVASGASAQARPSDTTSKSTNDAQRQAWSPEPGAVETSKLIGTKVRRLDTPAKIAGAATFGIDVQFPDLRTAVVARPPAFGATLVDFDAAAALRVPGVEKVVPTATGVAVVAKHFWAAKLGRDALVVHWRDPEGTGFDSTNYTADLRALVMKPGAIVADVGKVDEALAAGIEAPIVPGIMPILSFSKLARFSDACGAEIPRWIRRKLESFGDDTASIRAFGLDVVTDLCDDLLAHGAPGLHFYTLNRSPATREIFANLGLSATR